MKKLINRFKSYFTTDILDLDLNILDILLIVMGLVYMIFILLLPMLLIVSLFFK